jgi:N utilization substance protein B
MGPRRRARELALQALFFADASSKPPDEALALFCTDFPPPESARPFFLKLTQGVTEKKKELDALIERFSKNWKLYRMSGVDRNAMRIAVFEFLYCDDIPATISINEAIELGKKYGTSESGAFINGILDCISINLKKKNTA